MTLMTSVAVGETARPSMAPLPTPASLIRTILVPLDGSRLSDHALPEARRLAQQTGASLLLVRAAQARSIVPDALAAQMAAVTEAEDYLQRHAETVRGTGLAVSTEVYCNEAADAIIVAAIVHSADLIVMSTHGRSGLSRAVYASVAERVQLS